MSGGTFTIKALKAFHVSVGYELTSSFCKGYSAGIACDYRAHALTTTPYPIGVGAYPDQDRFSIRNK